MYQQYYPQYQQYYPQNAQHRKVDIVQGEVSAEVYPVEAGQEVILVDMDNPFVYRKARGFDNVLQPMKKFRLVQEEEVEEEQTVLTVEQVQEIVRQEIEKSKPKRPVKKEADE